VERPFLIGSLKPPPPPIGTSKEVWKQKLDSSRTRKEKQVAAISCLAKYMNIRQYPPKRKRVKLLRLDK